MNARDYERARGALAFIPSDDRDMWVSMGMAIKDGFGDEGFALWDAWSRQSNRYNERDARDVWRSIKAGGGITLGTLFHEAKARGWRDDGTHQKPTPEELAERRRLAAEGTAKEEAEKARERAEAAGNAAAIWRAATPTSANHPYLARKQVAPVESLREIEAGAAAAVLGYASKRRGEPLIGRLLVVPVKVAGELSTVEFIDEAGRKSVLYGSAKTGGYWAAQMLPNGDGIGLTLLIGEGVATVLSARQATGYLVVAALSSANLPAAAREMRKRFPKAALVLLADLAKATGDPDPHAIEAARAVGGRLILPDFGEDRPDWATDLNDMHQLQGREVVAECIRRQVDAGEGGLEEDEPRPGNGAAPGANCESHVILARGDTLSVKPIRWTWDGYLARSKLHVLAGAIGTGKSTIAIDFAAVVTTGGRWPDGTKCDPGDVLVWSDEDDPEDTLLPRFLAAGGDPRRIHFVTGTVDRDGKRHFDPATDIPGLIAAARNTTDLGLVIVDPVVTVVAGDSHKNTEVRRALRPLVGLASDLASAVLGVSHHTKGTAGRDPVERITGSLAFGALPRVTMAAARDGSDPERRIFCRTKSNIGPDTDGWEYRLGLADVPGVEGVRVVAARWGNRLEGSAKDLLAGAEATGDPEERDKLDDAADWLGKLLKDGPVDSLQIAKDAKQSGIAQPTLERAKTKLRVKSRKKAYAGGWWWGLPEHWPPEDDPQDHENDQQPQNDDHLGKPTPLKPSCGAGSTEGDQAPEDDPPSTPLKPSCGAGSTEGDQAPEKNEGVDHLRSNLAVARVPGVSGHHGAEGVDHLRSNPAVVRVPGDPNSQDDQGFEVVGEKGAPTGGADLCRRVVITIGEGAAKRSFETSDPAGLTLADWRSRVLKAYGAAASVRGVAP